ncbi:MAG: DALR domain-containing protein, partial [Candidatus Nitrotoga sp.]
PIETGSIDWNEPYSQRFKAAMDDDFNTPEAMAVLFDLANEVNRSHSVEAAKKLKMLGEVLGLLQQNPADYLQGKNFVKLTTATFSMTTAPINVEALIAERTVAKQSKNFAESDRIRKELLDAGIVLEDSASGTTWRRA